jgi:hypothetical protein
MDNGASAGGDDYNRPAHDPAANRMASRLCGTGPSKLFPKARLQRTPVTAPAKLAQNTADGARRTAAGGTKAL